VRKVYFLIILLVFPLIAPVRSGSISGLDVYSINQCKESTITDMNYDNETKVFYVNITGPTGLGWFWIMFGVNSDPKEIYSPHLVNVTRTNSTFFKKSTNETLPAVEYNLTLLFQSPASIEFRYYKSTESSKITPIFIIPTLLGLVVLLKKSKS